jgi:hypothetical protein
MADPSAHDSSGESGSDQTRDYGQGEPDRRKTVDLLRVERGEPERRKLPRFELPRQARDREPPQEQAG